MSGDTHHAQKSSLQAIKEELEKERARIEAILVRRTSKDAHVAGNYITDFPDTDTDALEVDEEVYQDEEYEVNLDIEHVLEKRLQKIEEDLQKIADGVYKV